MMPSHMMVHHNLRNEVETKWPPFCRRHFQTYIFWNENFGIFIQVALKFVPKGSVNNNPALVLMMEWCRTDDEPLSEPVMVINGLVYVRHWWVYMRHWWVKLLITCLRPRMEGGGWGVVKTSGPRENGRNLADDIFKCILLNENCCIFIEISLKFVPKGPINNITALVHIMV